MKKVFVSLVVATMILMGCSATEETIPHGEAVADEPNLPFAPGEYETVNETVDYGPALGYKAQPSSQNAQAGVILIHEWWGLNNNIKETADKIASHGYNVLAVDLYNGSVATTPKQAQNLSSSVTETQALRNLRQAQRYLRGQGVERTASFGFCFGGDQSMRFAVDELSPDASVIYYGSPVLNASQLSTIDQPVLGVFGTDDSVVDVDDARRLDSLLDGVTDHDMYYYEGAEHAFANPSGDSFNANASRDAWNKTVSFLDDALKR